MKNLFEDLMNLCSITESFYFVDHEFLGTKYRVFTYRLASFTDFQHKNALECRGHTFRYTDDYGWQLVSLPMNKFFNYDEHIGWGQEIDLSGDIMIMDKLDGSLISTVYNESDEFILKSKTSFTSQQARDASEWLANTSSQFFVMVYCLVQDNYTVNFEWTSPNNTIVIGYDKPKLTVLNVRNMRDGSYLPYNKLIELFGKDNVVKIYDRPDDPYKFLEDSRNLTGIEGYVIQTASGLMVKHKCSPYLVLHRLKESVTNDRRLFETCVNEASDDARALFVHDKIIVDRIVKMEEKVSNIFNHIHKSVYDFYNKNKHLDRKSYAILGQEKLNSDGIFSLAMNLYLGKECDIKSFMIKNYKKYGIKDEEQSE